MHRPVPRAILDYVLRQTRAIRHQRAGSISLIFALAIVPLILAVGACIDYAIALIVEMQLQTAADAAALGCLSQTSPAIISAVTKNQSGEIAAAETDATNIADATFGSSNLGSVSSRTIKVNYASNTFTADVSLSASVPTYFMGMIGVKTLSVAVHSSSTYRPALYYTFYILIDNSPSMGLGATPADITALETATAKKDGAANKCAFACHITGSTTDWYVYAKNHGITLRINVVASAVQSMIAKAKSSQSFTGQYAMAVYSLGTSAESDFGLKNVYGPSTDLATVATKAATVDLMTIKYQNYNNDQETDLLGNLTAIKKIMGTSGSGVSASDPIKVLFLITDGVEDVNRTPCNEKLASGNRCQQEMDYSACTQIKANGVRVVGLYTTYQAVPNNDWYNNYVAPYKSKIPLAVKACATDGLYYEVGPGDDVGGALTDLFASVISMTHLTK